ncbi:uncharacterized protein C18orf19 homolog A [Agrilus planipennis]|uniref:Uncharacterized protein C18orf19 homolog A n=1 Tax=Agrilus planipennis TaxID=224129 RepID=A0A1W4XBA4_AGRPL|nr:uncharacterized protein C18orf19 homolog A [Agrilus planipennis]
MASICARRLCQRKLSLAIRQHKLLMKVSRLNKFHFYANNEIYGSNWRMSQVSLSSPLLTRSLSEQKKESNQGKDLHPKQKTTLFQRFKQMYRDYWYVLVPVHLVTSAAWFGGFYYLAKSGVDVVAILESMHISERIVNPLRDSSLGYIAVSYALYKIATPLRYTVTLGGTTISIKFLKEWGYIKPVPSKEQLKEMYKEKKDSLIITVREKRDELVQKKDQLKDKKDAFVDNLETNLKKKIKESAGDITNKKLFGHLEKNIKQSGDDKHTTREDFSSEISKNRKN